MFFGEVYTIIRNVVSFCLNINYILTVIAKSNVIVVTVNNTAPKVINKLKRKCSI